MKKIFKASLLVAAAVALFSCQKEANTNLNAGPQVPMKHLTIGVTSSPVTGETKTALDGVSIKFSEGDSIAVYYQYNSANHSTVSYFKGYEGDVAQFDLTIPEDFQPTDMFAAYDVAEISDKNTPYDVKTAGTPYTAVLRIEVDSVQTAVCNGIKGSVPMFAHWSGEAGQTPSFDFTNCVGLASFGLNYTGSDPIVKVSVSNGARIYKRHYVKINGDGSFAGLTGSTYTTITPHHFDLVGDFSEAGNYNIALAPADYSGIFLTFYTQSGKCVSFSNPNILTIKRGTKTSIGNFNLSDADFAPYVGANKTGTIDASGFAQDIDFVVSGSCHWTAQVTGGEGATLTPSEGDGITAVKLHLPLNSDEEITWTVTVSTTDPGASPSEVSFQVKQDVANVAFFGDKFTKAYLQNIATFIGYNGTALNVANGVEFANGPFTWKHTTANKVSVSYTEGKEGVKCAGEIFFLSGEEGRARLTFQSGTVYYVSATSSLKYIKVEVNGVVVKEYASINDGKTHFYLKNEYIDFDVKVGQKIRIFTTGTDSNTLGLFTFDEAPQE